MKKTLVRLALLAAKASLRHFETIYPEDFRPRKAVESVEKWLESPTEINVRSAENAAILLWQSKWEEVRAENAVWSIAWCAESVFRDNTIGAVINALDFALLNVGNAQPEDTPAEGGKMENQLKNKEKIEVKKFFLNLNPEPYTTGLEIETVDGRRFLATYTNMPGWEEIKSPQKP